MCGHHAQACNRIEDDGQERQHHQAEDCRRRTDSEDRHGKRQDGQRGDRGAEIDELGDCVRVGPDRSTGQQDAERNPYGDGDRTRNGDELEMLAGQIGDVRPVAEDSGKHAARLQVGAQREDSQEKEKPGRRMEGRCRHDD